MRNFFVENNYDKTLMMMMIIIIILYLLNVSMCKRLCWIEILRTINNKAKHLATITEYIGRKFEGNISLLFICFLIINQRVYSLLEYK